MTRQLISIFSFCLIGLSLSSPLAAATAPGGEKTAGTAKPNVLFIASDDLRTWLNGYGDSAAHTPNLDRLAARGVTFRNAQCGAPVCNPSRTSLITGMRPSVTGVYGNNVLWSSAVPEAMTIPLLFKKNGYYVSGAGKITHGNTVRASDWNDFGPVGKITTKGETLLVRGLQWKVIPDAEENTLSDHVSTSYVVDRLQRKYSQPFFLACGLHMPHVNWNVPKKYFDLYPLDQIKQPPINAHDLDDVPPIGQKMALGSTIGQEALPGIPGGPEKAIQAYRAAISFMDAQVGRLLDALDASPYRDNTIIVFWGDNGWHLGEKGHWAKGTLWKESTSVPLVWVAPGVTKPNSICTHPVDLLSVFPTLCALTKLAVPAQCKDLNLMPLLADPQGPWDHPAVTTMGAGNHSVVDDNFRYIRYSDGTEELYDHSKDPNEWTNVAANPELAPIKARLAQVLPKNDVPDKGDKTKKGGDE